VTSISNTPIHRPTTELVNSNKLAFLYKMSSRNSKNIPDLVEEDGVGNAGDEGSKGRLWKRSYRFSTVP